MSILTVSTNRRAARFPSRDRLAYVAVGVLVVLCSGVRPPILTAQSNGTTPGAIRTYSTISSIGVEWDIVGDADHDATAAVEFRVAGTAAWRPALPLVRVDYNGSNMLAGSILFLSPNAAYEIRLTLADPDGGAAVQTVAVTTRPVPVMPVSGRSFHVVPGSGGGDGSSANPFRGIAAAEAVAQPGDTFLVHAGSYGGRITFTRPGTSTAYVVWKSAGDGEALFAGIDVSASYVWLEGLTLRDQPFALMSKNAPTGVVISRCSFFNNHYSIYLQRGGSNWYIADNTIVGDTPYSTESLDGEGIELNGYSVESFGHVVAHNSISNVADGISNGTYNIDVFGNDIFDTSDDGFEGDPGGANIRVWGNRIHNAAHNGISYQPQNGSPWYILRNQLVGFMEAPFKFRTTDRSVIAHNTIRHVGQDDLLQRCAPAAIDRQEQPVGGGVRRADLGFRVDCEGLAERFQQRRLRLGSEHGAVQVRRRGLLEPRRLRGGVRSRDERTTDQSDDVFRDVQCAWPCARADSAAAHDVESRLHRRRRRRDSPEHQ